MGFKRKTIQTKDKKKVTVIEPVTERQVYNALASVFSNPYQRMEKIKASRGYTNFVNGNAYYYE